MVEVSGSVARVPLVGWVPLQPPEAVQLSAPLALHFKVTEWPAVTVFELGVKFTAGLATAATESRLPV